MMLRDYFIQMLKLRSNKALTTVDINNFIYEMDTTIKAVQNIVDKKVQEYLER